MAWSIEGTYFETCSCELMCPCNMSFDHGATYDYCRVVLVFNITHGEIEGTDVGGEAKENLTCEYKNEAIEIGYGSQCWNELVTPSGSDRAARSLCSPDPTDHDGASTHGHLM